MVGGAIAGTTHICYTDGATRWPLCPQVILHAVEHVMQYLLDCPRARLFAA